MEAVIYLRVGKAEQITDVGNRINALTDLCNSKGMVIKKVITEDGSGLDSDREGYKEAIRMAKEGEVDAIVVEKLEKLSRDYNVLYPVLEELHEKGVTVCGPNFDYSAQRQEEPVNMRR